MGFWRSMFGSYSGPHIMFHGARFTPEQFGKAAVIWSADSSQDVVNSILGLRETSEASDSIYSRIAENLGVTQIQVMPLSVALYANALLKVQGTTREVARDFRVGVDAAFANGPYSASVSKAMIGLFEIYGPLLLRELDPTQTLMHSPVSDAVTNFICEGLSKLDTYKARPALQISTFEKNAISLMVTTCIAAQFKAFAQMNLHVVPARHH